MKKYLIALALVGFATTSCYEKLNIAPPNRITNDQIQELLKSDPEKAEAIMSSVAAGMVPLFHEKDIRDMGSADTRYYNYADVACMRNLEANDIAAMGTDLSGSVWGMAEYNLITVFGEHDDKVPPYWYLCWDNITAANKLLDNLPMSTVGDNKKLKQYRAMGLVTRAYFYNYLMENFQQAYMLDETGAPYYLYCTVEAKPGYVFRSGTGTLKYANEEWKPGKWAEAIWNDDWMDMDNISAGACYKLHDESDTNLGGLWLNRLELTSLNLSVKAPVAGESPAPGSDYCKIDGLPPYMKLERVDWLKCYDDWRYYSDKPFTFQAGKTSDGESCEYQCFIYVSYDLSGVGVAKGAKFYLNDTPCKLDWENKFFWTETMTAEGNPVQEDPVITAKAGANGTITPSGSVTVKAGADQAFAIQPNSGYTVSKVLVDGTDVGAVTSYTFKNVTANHTIEAVFAKVEAKPTNPFVDVAEGTYYYDPVLWAVANGITSGVDATHFEPDGTCTRAHAVTFLWRASGQPEPKTTNMPFRDVKPGSYYEKAVLWAVENKITNGTSTTTFSPDENCTRAQIVTFLWRSEGEPYASDSNNPFTDIASDYYMDAVFWAVKEGITKGTTPTTFSPNERCTRGQIVTFIYRAMAS